MKQVSRYYLPWQTGDVVGIESFSFLGLNFWQVLQVFANSSMLLLMPGQYITLLALAFIISVPPCAACK